MSMTTEEILMLQALKFKEAHAGTNHVLTEAILAEAVERPDAPVRNICALVSVPLFDEVESYCSLLNLSKRKFVEMALQDFLQKVHAVVDKVQPWPSEE